MGSELLGGSVPSRRPIENKSWKEGRKQLRKEAADWLALWYVIELRRNFPSLSSVRAEHSKKKEHGINFQLYFGASFSVSYLVNREERKQANNILKALKVTTTTAQPPSHCQNGNRTTILPQME